MLQLRHISKVLSQGLGSSNSRTSPLSISLLSSNGLPLSTVRVPNQEKEHLTNDNLKIYSLLALNQLRQQNDDEWGLLELDENLKVVISKLELKNYINKEQIEDKREEGLYVVIFYDSMFSDAEAKLRLDNLCSALSQGLEGYRG
ncbi:hypothetical protein HYPBUDRAFT_152151 [Hyphopichia burtonii NRRL Y-1933]|uniref:Uncharacterized protein n=1 Tax=Hyphopichia burtonii NRRL Y-1933 TaxID=984485 RepID=A0A1E4RNN2_9ASCO|nr:hypothetical protein HYPBUDRAFT_152151 [Hyphopichia burtonii NRRL Y-1933]ODV68859.1 hypothetical protein HYPBUDRAFT_152151 [Hyphopichia burtonii NRRL Y-1933]